MKVETDGRRRMKRWLRLELGIPVAVIYYGKIYLYRGFTKLGEVAHFWEYYLVEQQIASYLSLEVASRLWDLRYSP